MARLLVTGGAGFIGTNFVYYWLEHHAGDRVVVLDALTYAGSRANLAPVEERGEFRFVHGDVCDTELVEDLLRSEELDTIVHFAAESHVDRSIEGPDAFIRTNMVGTHSVLKAARRVWLDERSCPRHRFHHISTDEVYGSLLPADPPFTEVTRYAPNSPYSASKAASDHLVRAYHRTYGLSTTISNCSNNYGPYQFPEKLIPLSISLLLDGKPLTVYGDGLHVRDWLFVEDHCRGIDSILVRGNPGEVYNLGGNSECANLDLIRALCSLLDDRVLELQDARLRYPRALALNGSSSETLISYVADRLGHDRRYAIDCGKVVDTCDFRPRVNLETGLAKTVDWYLTHPERLARRWQKSNSESQGVE
jgi:dTDP-glucose 4,6-dehydratase